MTLPTRNLQRIAAFSIEDTGGNPAGVLIMEQLPGETEMQAIAAQIGFSETVFAAPGDPAWTVRYFSPESEVPFCGHATIALGAALALEKGDGVFHLQLRHAQITVEGRRDGNGMTAALQSPPTRSRPAPDALVGAALALFGYQASELDGRIPPALIHAGADHLVLVLNSREALARMRYDLEAGRTLMKEAGLDTVMLAWVETPQRFHVRNAFASGGVYEDPATGAAAAAFAGYLRDLDWPHAGVIELVQGEDMGSRSLLRAELSSTPGSSVRISGQARVMEDDHAEGAEPNQVAPQPQMASAAKSPLWLRVVRNPLSRLILFFVLLFLFSSAIRWAFPLPTLEIDQALKLTGPPLWLRALRSLMPPVLAYWVLVRLIERRPIAEFSAKKAIPHSVIGWLVGMAIMLSTAAAMWLVGVLDFHGVNAGVNLLAPLLILAVVPGIAEEIIVRGVLFRVVEDGLGTWIALAISAAIFGFGHYANPNADIWSSVAIAIEAGLLLGMAYAWTRSLWFVAGLHAAWNFTQGALLGIPVSGMAVKGWVHSTTQGPDLLSGGEFGAEASLLAVLVCIAFAAYFTRKAITAGKIVPPFWRRGGHSSPMHTPSKAHNGAAPSLSSP